MKKTILVGAIVFTMTAGIMSAESMTLTVDEAVELSIAQNLGLKQSAISLRTKERAKDTAWNAFLPSMVADTGLSANSEIFEFNSGSTQKLSDPGALGVSAGLNFSLPINIAVGTGIKNLVANFEAGQISYEEARKKLERDVRKQFYLLLGNQENIRVQQSNLELAEKRLEQARNNFRNGLSPELEVLSAQVAVDNLRPVVDGVKASYESLLLFFKFLIGADRNDEVILNGTLDTELYTLDAEDLINRYMAKRLDIQGLEKELEALGYSKKTLARNFNTPTLSLGYNYGLSGSNADTSFGSPVPDIDPWSDWADRSTLSLGLQWKFDGLITGSKSNVQLREMQDTIDTLEISKRIALENAGIEITNLVNQLATSRRTIEANSSSVELALRTFQLTDEAYAVGTRELLDVQSAQNDYLSAVQQLVLAKYEYVAGLLDLEFALNTPQADFLENK